MIHKRYTSLFPLKEHDGFCLFFMPKDLPMVLEGLRLLQQHYPRAYRRAQRFVPTIVETNLPTHYDANVDACYLNLVDSPDPVEVAASLVHEATHGYLTQQRRMEHRGASSEKQERICMSQQGKFMAVCASVAGRDVDEYKRIWKNYTEKSLVSRWWMEGKWSRLKRLLQVWKARDVKESAGHTPLSR